MNRYIKTLNADWMVPLAGILVSVLAAYAAHKILFHILNKSGRNGNPLMNTLFGRHLKAPTRLIAILVGLGFGMSLFNAPKALLTPLETIVRVSWIWAVAWLLMRAVSGLDSLVLRMVGELGDDNLEAKVNYTKFQVFQRTANVVIALLALAAMFTSFEPFRRMGTTLLASAGLAGVILGFAAQKTLSGLLAGIQIAFAQPVRVDDVVVMEGEYGRVEEINFTYVVVRLWDQRRLVLHITYFLEKPFQNWTRTKANVTGTIFLHVAYEADLQTLRAELQRICESRPDLWDGQVCGLQVTDTTQDSMVLRALASSTDAAKNWDLRCLVREGLIVHLRKTQPSALPRRKLDVAAALPAPLDFGPR